MWAAITSHVHRSTAKERVSFGEVEVPLSTANHWVAKADNAQVRRPARDSRRPPW